MSIPRLVRVTEQYEGVELSNAEISTPRLIRVEERHEDVDLSDAEMFTPRPIRVEERHEHVDLSDDSDHSDDSDDVSQECYFQGQHLRQYKPFGNLLNPQHPSETNNSHLYDTSLASSYHILKPVTQAVRSGFPVENSLLSCQKRLSNLKRIDRIPFTIGTCIIARACAPAYARARVCMDSHSYLLATDFCSDDVQKLGESSKFFEKKGLWDSARSLNYENISLRKKIASFVKKSKEHRNDVASAMQEFLLSKMKIDIATE